MNIHDDLNHVRTWSNERYNADGTPNTSFPWPDQYTRHVVTGELADRIRFALTRGRPETLQYDPVFITETKQYGGYSEYTQDNFVYIKVESGDEEKVIEPSDSGNAFSALLDWMDESEREHALTPAEIAEILTIALENGWERK